MDAVEVEITAELEAAAEAEAEEDEHERVAQSIASAVTAACSTVQRTSVSKGYYNSPVKRSCGVNGMSAPRKLEPRERRAFHAPGFVLSNTPRAPRMAPPA